MAYQIDFTLSRQFTTLDKTVFRLILNGYTNVYQICDLLYIFSEDVMATSIRKLVNKQILIADIDNHTVSLSEPILAIISQCLDKPIDIRMPENLLNLMIDGKLLVTDIKVKAAIISNLIPDVKLDFLARVLNFYIYDRGKIV